MRVLQRMVLIILLLVVYFGGRTVTVLQREAKLVSQWEALQTDLFLRRLCEVGQIFYEDVLLYVDSLEQRGGNLSVRLEELQREQDFEGNIYYYPVSWEELLEQMTMGKGYRLEEDSILVIIVERYNRKQRVETRYCEVVPRKG